MDQQFLHEWITVAATGDGACAFKMAGALVETLLEEFEGFLAHSDLLFFNQHFLLYGLESDCSQNLSCFLLPTLPPRRLPLPLEGFENGPMLETKAVDSTFSFGISTSTGILDSLENVAFRFGRLVPVRF